MAEPADSRVAVYIDFDNIVISRYDQVHGRGQYMRDKSRGLVNASGPRDQDEKEKLTRATVDVGAIIDFASSFGTLVLTRAYADWSAPVNADYRGQLVSRAVDLVQLFPAAAYAKNGADIRLAVDAIEDMFRLPDLTHVIIVAGDSDYIALAQRCKRLGRYVVGIGVAGSTSRSLAAACDDFATYDALPGVKPIPPAPVKAAATAATESGDPADGESTTTDASATQQVEADGTAAEKPPRTRSGRSRSRKAADPKAATADGTGEGEGATPSTEDDPSTDAGASAAEASASSASAPRSRRTRASSASLAASDSPADPADGSDPSAVSDTSSDTEPTEVPVADAGSVVELVEEPPAEPVKRKRAPRRAQSPLPVQEEPEQEPEPEPEPEPDPQEVATGLFERALRLGHEKDDADWLHSSNVKTQMKRMDPSFSEKALGYRTFSDFIKSRAPIAELDESSTARLVRLTPED